MAEIINLNRARKQRAQAESRELAQRNRVVYGRTRAEKDLARRENDGELRRLDGKKLEGDPEDGDGEGV
jgi:hypothetical protein